MKRVILIFICIFIVSTPCFSVSETSLGKLNAMVDKATVSKNIDDWNMVGDMYLKECEKDPSFMRVELLDALVKSNADRYDLTNDKRYLNKAHHFAFIAMKYGTTNLNTVIYGITLSASMLNESKMIEAYDYMTKINPKAANAVRETFIQNLQGVKQYKANRSAQKWNTFGTLLNTYMQNRPNYRPTYSTTTGTIDSNGYVNINTMSY